MSICFNHLFGGETLFKNSFIDSYCHVVVFMYMQKNKVYFLPNRMSVVELLVCPHLRKSQESKKKIRCNCLNGSVALYTSAASQDEMYY